MAIHQDLWRPVQWAQRFAAAFAWLLAATLTLVDAGSGHFLDDSVPVVGVLVAIATWRNTQRPVRLAVLVKGLSSSTGAPAAGKLAFMSGRTGFVVTPDPDTNVGNAVGVYLWTPTNKGDYCLIVNLGDVETRCKATVTNASTAGKPVYAVSDSSLGVIDGLADATAVTNLILGTEVGKVITTLSNGGLVRTYIQPKLRVI